MPILGKKGKKIWIAAACGALLIILAALILQSRFVKQKILSSAKLYLQKSQGIHLAVDSFDYNLLKLQLVLRGIQLQKWDKTTSSPMFRADEVRINIPLSLILRRRLRIQDLEIVNPEIFILIDQDGNSNLPFKAGVKKSPQTQKIIPDFLIEHFEAKNVQINFTDRRRNLELGLSEIGIKGEGYKFGLHSFSLEMRRAGVVKYRNRSIPLERWLVQAKLDREILDIQKLVLASAKNEIEFFGKIRDFSSFVVEGSMQGHFDLQDLLPLVAVDVPFSGNVEFRTNVKGPLQELEARIDMKSEDMSIGKIEEIGMGAELYWKDSTLDVLSFAVRKEKGEIQGQGILHPSRWDDGNQLNLKWKNMDLGFIMDFIQSPYLFSAQTTGSMDVSWDGFSWDDVSGECEVHFIPKETKELQDIGTPLNGKIVAKADTGRLDIIFQDISLLDTDLKGKLHWSSDEVSGDFGLEVQSVGRLMPLILAFAKNLDERDVRRLGIDGPVSVSASVGGNLRDPLVRFDVESTSFQFFKTRNLKIEGNALFDLRSLQIESLLVEDGEGKIEISGIYPLKPAGRNMQVDIQGDKLSVKRILEIFGSKLEAEGFIQVEARIEGRTDAPRFESRWLVSDASLYKENLGEIEVNAHYQQSKIICDSVRVTKATGTLQASGFYDFQRNEFRVNLEGKSFPLDGLKVAGDLDRIRAELDINFEAYGDFENPYLKTQGKISQLSIGTQALSDWEFKAQSGKDEIGFRAEAPIFASTIDGTISLESPYVLNADLSIDKMRFEELRTRDILFERLDISGLVTAGVHMNMDLRDPRKTLSCEASIENIQLQFRDGLVRNDGPILLSFGAETLRVERLLLIGGGTRIKAEGSLPLNIPSSSKILLSAVVDLSLLNDFYPIEDCKGSLKLETQLLGSLLDLEIAAEMDLHDAQLPSSLFPFVIEDVQAHIEIKRNLLLVDSFSGRIAESRFVLKGEIPFASVPFRLPVKLHDFEEEKTKLVLDIENWDPATLGSLVPNPIFQHIRGKIGGRIEMEGIDFQPEHISAKGLFETFELYVSGVSLRQDAPSQISVERGKLSIERLSLRDGENRLNISGTASLTGGEDLKLSLVGELEMKLIRIFLQEGIFSGKMRFQILIASSYESPAIQGFMDIQDGRYQRIYPRLLLEQVSGRIKLMGNQAEIEKIQGILNGGKTAISGKIGLSGWPIPEAEIILKNEESLFDFPRGLRSQVSGDLKFISDGESYQTVGTITILDARYRDDFKVGTAVYNLLRKGSVRETLREPNPYLNRLNLDINIGIPNNFIIDNNIAKAEVSADLRLIGTPYNPGLSGRASIAEGGEIYFNQNIFSIEQGTVDFINPTRIEPDLNLSARTQVQEYNIGLIVQGTPDKLTASLVSDPPLSEPNIISLLVMGRTLESASASVASVAGSTALSYLNNAITGRIEQATAKMLGLESVRIDAGLVSTEENPEARITIGQHISRDFELVFSQDLKDARNQMWMLNYNPFKSFNIQGIKRDNNELNLALRHEIQFGLNAIPHQIPQDKAETKKLIVGNIHLGGDIRLPESVIFKSLKLKRGKNINFAELQEALERIRKLYQKNNHLNLSLAARREETNGYLNILLQMDSGPKIFLDYAGDQIPNKVKREIVETWFGSTFGQLAVEDIEQRIRVHFIKKRYYQVKVNSIEKRGEKGERILVFQTIQGHRFGKPDFRIAGNRALSEKVIAAHLERSGAMNSVFYQPTEWVKSLEEFYILHGYLHPKIKLPVVHLDPEKNKASVDVSLEEGDRFKVGAIKIEGLHFFEDNQVLSEIDILTGDIVSPVKLNQVDHKIYDLYVQMGFNDFRVQSDFQVNVENGTVDLNIDIQENQRGVIAEIGIEGNTLTDEKIILRELKFEKGDVVNFRAINATRKGLYDLGVFERVNIDITPLKQGETNPEEGTKEPDNDEKYFQVVINMTEFKPYRLRYGFQYDTESSFGVLANLINRNFLGNANLLGGSIRLNRDERDTRFFFRSPYFFSRKISSEIFVFNNRLTKHAFTLDRTGFTLQQQLKIKMSNVISYNYTFEKIDTLYPMFEGLQSMDTTDRIGTLNVAFTRDTRDDIVNATRGMFLSQSIRYAPGFLGSHAQFIRYFGQYNTYQRLSVLFTYAASIRIGLGKGFNEDLPASERFFAGGGTTIRGFKKDELGSRDPSTDLPLGGDAVFVLNQELRFPIFKKFGGVIFLDLGNVYPKISDFDISDIRKTAGVGFRLHTPFVLVRLDWGFKLDRRTGETLSQIFFSIGQAF